MLMTMVPDQPEWGNQSRNLRGEQRRGESELQLPMRMKPGDLDSVLGKHPVLGNKATAKRNFIDRTQKVLADVGVNCNTLFLIKAFGTESVYKYVFNMFPAIHGLDTSFTVGGCVVSFIWH